MNRFELISDYKPAGDQPQAIDKLAEGVLAGLPHQVLLGVTGSGKTFTVANVIEKLQRPTLVISHNKTLAAQLFQEFREFFPKNAVEYFVSYYDYYQPEAYIPQRDQYIEKEAEINETIDRLRHSTTASLLTGSDVIVVASVSCIYNIGSPIEYGRAVVSVKKSAGGDSPDPQKDLLNQLVDLHYERSEYDFKRSTFRVRGDTVDVWPSYSDSAVRVEFGEGGVISVKKLDPLTGNEIEVLESALIYPAKHFMTSREVYDKAVARIQTDLKIRIGELKSLGKDIEAYRIKQRTEYDLEMIQEIGYCSGIENYSRYFDGRKTGDPPFTLLDYFRLRDNFLVVIDESHITIPQIRGMYNGDKSRKEILVEYGFRLPSAKDNRPLKFEEFLERVDNVVYTSATPSEWELQKSQGQIIEQLIRPTGLIDPQIEVRRTQGQVDDLMNEIRARVEKHERVLVTTLTKRLAEELSNFFEERGVKAHYLHSGVETLARSDILNDLRRGVYDVVVGINLLREGLDLPEVSLVAVLDADKEGFLRSETSLIQLMGRAARHVSGKVILYADTVTGSMRRAINEVERRRSIQLEYNKKRDVIPKSVEKPIRERIVQEEQIEGSAEEESLAKSLRNLERMSPAEREKLANDLELRMLVAAKNLDFELAAKLRDTNSLIKKSLRI